MDIIYIWSVCVRRLQDPVMVVTRNVIFSSVSNSSILCLFCVLCKECMKWTHKRSYRSVCMFHHQNYWMDLYYILYWGSILNLVRWSWFWFLSNFLTLYETVTLWYFFVHMSKPVYFHLLMTFSFHSCGKRVGSDVWFYDLSCVFF